jgi:hypothetical protein
MIIDLIWNGSHWVAILPESKLMDKDAERLKSRIRNHGYYPGKLRY